MVKQLAVGMLVMAILPCLPLFTGCGGGGGAPADTRPPAIMSVNVSRQAETGSVEVMARVSDVESGVARVLIQAAGISQEIAMQPASGVDWYRAVLTEETGRFRVRAFDNAGNEAVSGEVRVPPPNPPSF